MARCIMELAGKSLLPGCSYKMLTTTLTIGSRGVGEFFMPSLFMGASIGSVIHGTVLPIPGENTSSAASHALIGMGAYLGATMRAPLTSIAMIFELNRDYALLLPLMFGCILSSFVARSERRSAISS